MLWGAWSLKVRGENASWAWGPLICCLEIHLSLAPLGAGPAALTAFLRWEHILLYLPKFLFLFSLFSLGSMNADLMQRIHSGITLPVGDQHLFAPSCGHPRNEEISWFILYMNICSNTGPMPCSALKKDKCVPGSKTAVKTCNQKPGGIKFEILHLTIDAPDQPPWQVNSMPAQPGPKRSSAL